MRNLLPDNRLPVRGICLASFFENPQLDSQPATTDSPVQAPVPYPQVEGQPPIVPQLPPSDPVWTGWDVLLLAVLTLLTLAAAEVVTVIAASLFFYPHSNFRDLMQMPSLNVIGEFVGYLAVAAYMIMLVEGKYRVPFWRAIHWGWNASAVLKMLGLGVCTVTLDFLARYLPMPKSTPFDEFFSRPADAYLIAIFAVTFGPLMEELFFRGFLYPVLLRRTGVILAVLLTALPFGLMHYVQYKSWSAVLVITLVGVVLTVVRAVTNSVAASFLVHVGYNATLMVLTALATDGFRHMQKLG